MLPLVVRVPGEGWVHDDQVELAVADAADEVVHVLGTAPTSGCCSGLLNESCLHFGCQQFVGAYRYRAAVLFPVGHCQGTLHRRAYPDVSLQAWLR